MAGSLEGSDTVQWVLRISSAVVLIVTALFFVEDNITSQWRQAQADYSARLLTAASNEQEATYARSFEIRPRQIELRQLERVDRCVSCHVGVENPAAADWPQPLTMHSGEILAQHDIERMGCTVCHDGQGRATTVEAAHATAEGLFWDKPLLEGDLLQSTCVRCHNEPPAYAARFVRGQQLFDTLGCRGCHRVEDDGMSLGPDLTHVGDASFALKHPVARNEELVERFGGNINAAYLFEAVREPAAQPPDSVMPSLELSDAEIVALTVYLKGLTERASALRIVPQAVPAEQREPLLALGERLFNRYCRGCHGDHGRGGTPNPNAEAETIPQLDELAERMMLFEPEQADAFVAYLVENEAPPVDLDDLDVELPRGRITLVQWRLVGNVIRNGNPSGMSNPEGPNPIDMPAWKDVLSDREITAVTTWLLTQYPWES